MHNEFNDIFLTNSTQKYLFVLILSNPFYSDSFSFACVIIDVKPYVIVMFYLHSFHT